MDTVLIDLSEDNVEGIFLKCLTGPKTKLEDAFPVQLMLTTNGFKKSDNAIFFDQKKIDDSKELIDYLFGQLYAVHHSKFNIVDVETLYKKYDGTNWTEKPSSIVQLCYLGLVTGNSKKWIFNANSSKTMVPLNSKIVPIPYEC